MKLIIRHKTNQSIILFHHHNAAKSGGGQGGGRNCLCPSGWPLCGGRPILCPAWLEPSVVRRPVRNAGNVHILGKWN